MKKIINKKTGEVYKLYSFDEAFVKDMKSPTFKKAFDEEMARIALSRQVRQLRLKKHLTQKMLADRAKMPQSVIARLESGEHSFSLDTLGRIAQAVGKRVVLA